MRGYRAVPRTIVVVSVVLLAGVVPCRAEWRRIDSPNFVVIGAVNARELREIATRFETFRETLSRVLTSRATSTPVPTIVLVFDSDRAFTPFKLLYNGKPVAMSGLFVPRPDVNYIAIVRGSGGDNVIFHEYAHLVVSNVARNVPVWLNEGLAEYYSTFESLREGRQANVGRPAPSHLMRLRDTRLLPLPTLISADRKSPLYNEGERRTIFYAQSWALTHLLLSGTPDRRPKLGDFLQYVGEGVPATEAWQRAFAGDNVEKALDEYFHQLAFRYSTISFPEKIVAFDATATVLAEDDVQAFLADFLIRQRRFDEAAERLKKLDPSTPRVRAVQARLAADKNDGGGVETALRGLDTPGDWLVAYYAGAALADARERDGSMPDARAAAARTMFDLVGRQRGEFAHVLAMQTELTARSRATPTAETRAAIERARELAPGRIDYAFLHANVLARLGDYAAARRVLGPLMSPGYAEDVRNAARGNMGIVVAQEEREKARKSAQAARTTADEPAPAVQHDAGIATPVFRRVAPGEQRMEGVLERIDCTPQGAATFSVRAPGGMVLLRAPRMSDVEFITYREDLSGRFGCGPLKTPLPVYVTWRPDPKTPTVRNAIAVEFLPKQQQ